MTLESASSKLNMIVETWHNFKKAHFSLLERSTDSQIPVLNELYAVVDDTYWRTSSTLSTRIQSLSTPLVGGSVNGGVQPDASLLQFHLGNLSAPIKLPEFNGTFSQWAAFRDSFIIDVIEDPRLSDAHKLRRLQSSVTGQAAKIMGTWAIKAENFQLAWGKLRSAYDDEYQSIRTHVKSMYELGTPDIESFQGLRDIIDVVSNSMRQLATLLTPDEQMKYFVLYLIETKLPNATKDRWEMFRSTDRDHKPTLENMLAFLERRASVAAGDRTISEDPPVKKFKTDLYKDRFPRGVAADKLSNRSVLVNCKLCNLNHALFHCPKFRNMDLVERNTHVRVGQLCRNCLQPGHWVQSCTKKPCPHCQGKHNGLLCPTSRPGVGTSKVAVFAHDSSTHTEIQACKGDSAEPQ